jgi:hypothetical protein
MKNSLTDRQIMLLRLAASDKQSVLRRDQIEMPRFANVAQSLVKRGLLKVMFFGYTYLLSNRGLAWLREHGYTKKRKINPVYFTIGDGPEHKVYPDEGTNDAGRWPPDDKSGHVVLAA